MVAWKLHLILKKHRGSSVLGILRQHKNLPPVRCYLVLRLYIHFLITFSQIVWVQSQHHCDWTCLCQLLAIVRGFNSCIGYQQDFLWLYVISPGAVEGVLWPSPVWVLRCFHLDLVLIKNHHPGQLSSPKKQISPGRQKTHPSTLLLQVLFTLQHLEIKKGKNKQTSYSHYVVLFGHLVRMLHGHLPLECETLGQTQNMLKRLHISYSLGMSRDAGDRRIRMGGGCLGFPTQFAGAVIWSPISGGNWMVGCATLIFVTIWHDTQIIKSYIYVKYSACSRM